MTTEQKCEDLVKEANELGQIDAIFNLAVVLQDALFQDQTKENFLASFTPKAHATVFLDKVSRKLCPNLRFSINANTRNDFIRCVLDILLCFRQSLVASVMRVRATMVWLTLSWKEYARIENEKDCLL